MIPGELFIKDVEIDLTAGRQDRDTDLCQFRAKLIQVGSPYHFFEDHIRR